MFYGKSLGNKIKQTAEPAVGLRRRDACVVFLMEG